MSGGAAFTFSGWKKMPGKVKTNCIATNASRGDRWIIAKNSINGNCYKRVNGYNSSWSGEACTTENLTGC